MSIFSRLFKGPEEEGNESSEDDNLLLDDVELEPSSEGGSEPAALPIAAVPVVQVGHARWNDVESTKENAAAGAPPPPSPGRSALRKPPFPPIGLPTKAVASGPARPTYSSPPPPATRSQPPGSSANARPGLPPPPVPPTNVGAPRARSATTRGLAPQPQTAQSAAHPAPFGSTAKGVVIESVNNLLDDLDAAFGAIVEPDSHSSDSPPARPPSAPPGPELRGLFASLAANHMRQVREFMIGIRWGEAPRDWVSICAPAVDSLVRAAKEMELSDLAAALEDYRKTLGRAGEARGPTIAGDTRDQIIDAYAALADLMPEAFALEGERGRREAIIVHSLLEQVPDVRKVTVDKIYAAGLATFEQMFVARPDEISAMTGIGESLASRIVDKFQSYRREISSLGDTTRASERRRLAELLAELRELQHEFERASSSWSEDAHSEKKRLRQVRTDALLQVKILLARIGEVDRLARLERLPFERKIGELEGYLNERSKEAPVR